MIAILEKYQLFLLFFLVATLGFINFQTVLGQSSSIPEWIKDTAKSWVKGEITDDDFIKLLQLLIDQKILIVPSQDNDEKNQTEGFSGIACIQGYNYVQMTGRYTNGDVPYSVIFLRLSLTNNAGDVVSTGSGIISNINAHQTKFFDAIAIYSRNFTSCDIQIDSAIPEKSNS